MIKFSINNEVVSIPECTELLAYRGSVAHGMKVEDSDPNCIDEVDLIGFVVPPTKCLLGFSEWGSRGTKEYKEGKWDCVYYDIRKAVHLLLQGNPNIMSILWLRPEHYLLRHWVGYALLDLRSAFVGKHVYNAFAGYAHGQLERMESRDPAELREYIAVTNELKYRGAHPNHKGERIPYPSSQEVVTANVEARNAIVTSTDKLLAKLASYHKKGENLGYMGDRRKQLVLKYGADFKNAAHCIRLLKMCIEFLETGTMTVYREHDSQELLDIKTGKWPLDRVKQYANDLFNDAKAARDRSSLPDGPGKEAVERRMVAVLKEYIEVQA